MVSLMGFFFTRSSSFFSGRGDEGPVGGVIFDEEVSIFSQIISLFLSLFSSSKKS